MPAQKYTVYLARFNFIEDGAAHKLRPVVVVSEPRSTYDVVTIVPISAQPYRTDVDIAIDGWQSAGLVRPSVARVHRLTAFLQTDLLEEIGQLQTKDKLRIKKSLQRLLDI